MQTIASNVTLPHETYCKGLRLLLDAEKDIRVVGEAGDGHAALEQVGERSPDVEVMDISMPGLNGIETTRQTCSDSPNTKVVALGCTSDTTLRNF